MKIRLLGSSVETMSEQQYLTSFVINDTVAIDAGSLGFHADLEAQRRVRHVVFSHTHMDHLASLPTFLENVYKFNSNAVMLHGSDEFFEELSKSLFNGRIWPDFLSLGSDDAPFCQTGRLQSETPFEVEGLSITPVEVNHGIPTFGFIVESPDACVAIASDTAATTRIWELASAREKLKGVFLDASFPEELQWLADVSYHLTPPGFAAEVGKLTRPARAYAVHLKARHRDQVVEELKALRLPDLQIMVPGKEYDL